MVSCTHDTLTRERARHRQQVRSALRDFCAAGQAAFEDLDAAGTLELRGKAPTPAQAARSTLPRISTALKSARRRDIAAEAATIQVEHLGHPEVLATANWVSIRALIAVPPALNTHRGLAGAGRGPLWVTYGR